MRCSASSANDSGRESCRRRHAALVDRVVAAEQDPAVVGAAVVVELVAHVADALAAGPPDRVPLRGRERLGDDDVVVDRHDVVREAAQQRRERVGREHHAAGAHDARPLVGLGDDLDRGRGRVAERGRAGALVDADAQRQAGVAQPPGQASWVHHGRAVTVVHGADVQRRVDELADLLAVEHLELLAVLRSLGGEILDALELVVLGRDVELAGALEGAVDAVAVDGGGDAREVLVAEPGEQGQLVGPAREAVGVAVGDRRGAEPAVAARRRPADATALDDHDVAGRVASLASSARPQPGEASADDEQVGVGVAGVRGPAVRGGGGRRARTTAGAASETAAYDDGRGAACERHDSHGLNRWGRPGSSGRYGRHGRAAVLPRPPATRSAYPQHHRCAAAVTSGRGARAAQGLRRHRVPGRYFLARAEPTAWATRTMPSAPKNMIEPITLTCGGMPRCAAPHTYSGNVTVVPLLKFVMMKSSNDSENASSAARGDARHDQRQRDVPEGRALVGVEVHRRLLQPRVEAGEAGLDRHDDEADAEHDVGDEDRAEAQRRAQVEEQREQGGAEDDLGRGHRQEDQQVRRRAAVEAVTHEGEGDERAEQGRDRRGDDARSAGW